MAQYNPTNYYTTLGDYTNVYVDMGTVYVDLSYNQTIQGVKTFGTAPMTNYANAPYQLVNKQYIDDNYNPINYKATMPVVNNISGAINNALMSSGVSVPNGFTKKSFTPLQNFTTIQRKMINTQIDMPANQDTYYTFGVSRPSMWLAGGTSSVNGNSLAYSYDGFSWTGIPSTDVSGVRALAFNGSIWVAGCGGYPTSALDVYGGTGARTTLAYSYNGFNWTPNYYANSIFTQSVNGLAWNGLIFVAAGMGGNSLGYSYDGIRWTGAASGPWNSASAFATSVAWNGSIWVATGTGGPTVCYSYNGIVWLQSTAVNTPFTTIGNCVAYDGVRWVAGGAGNPSTAMSFNGQSWITTAQSTGITSSVLGLAWNGNMWVAVGAGSNSISYSYDGYAWSVVLNNSFIFSTTGGSRCVAWNGYMWVAGAGQNSGSGSTLAYSYNGIQWFALGAGVFSGACNAIIWSGRRENIIYYPQNRTLLLGGVTGGTGPTIQYSIPYTPYQGSVLITGATTANLDYSTGGYITGVSWIEQAQPSSTSIFSQANGAAWNGYKWIAVGQAASTVYGYGNTMAFSTIIGNTNIGNAGNVWIGMQNRIFSVAGMNVAYNGNIWAAVGQGGNSIAWSSDGNSWFGLGTSIFSNYGQTIAWNGSYWLAGGNGTGNTMAFSYDGIVWSGLGNGIFNIQCNGLAWNGTVWVAVGYGVVNTMAYSTDGLNWNGLNKISFTTQGNDVAVSSSSGLWVAGGAGGNAIVNSTDGVNWYKTTTVSTTLFSTVCNSVTWNGKYWLASGAGTNTNAYSFDAMTWTGLGAGLFTGSGQRAVWNQGLGTNYIKNNYLVKSNLNTTSNLTIFFGQKSTLYYSTNGIVWNSKVQPYVYDMVVGIAYNGKIWAATTNISASLYAFIYSFDGINWVYSKTPIVDNLGPVYTNGIVFIAGSTINNLQYYSYDGINWTVGYNQSLTTILNVFVWNNNNHFWIGMGGTGAYNGAVLTNSVAYSVDGVGWFNMPNCNLNNFVCRSLAWNGSQFVAVGAPSVTGNPTPGSGATTGSYASLWASNDGQRWYCGLLSNPITNAGLTSGDTFSNTTGGTAVGFGQKSNSGRGIAWNGRLWVACGTGLQYGCNTSVIYSYDGLIWFNQPNNSDPFGATGSANNIFWNGVMFVCNGLSSSGASQLAYSYNGLNWFISPYNNNGTVTLQNNNTSTFMSNGMNNINKVQMNFNGPNQSKTLDIVADTYYNTGFNKTTFFA